MNYQDVEQMSLEQVAAATVRLGRELQTSAKTALLGGTGKQSVFVQRAFARLAERDPFDPRDEASLDAIREVLCQGLLSEIEGTECRFVETHYDENGQHGELQEHPIYTPRGHSLVKVQDTFRRFVEMRTAALDRIAAERALRKLLSM